MLPKEANNQEEVKEKQQDDKFLEDVSDFLYKTTIIFFFC